jgi:hypothetical protein
VDDIFRDSGTQLAGHSPFVNKIYQKMVAQIHSDAATERFKTKMPASFQE